MLRPALPYYRPALLALLACGLVLWGITYGYNRPIFLDEANLARNLYDRSVGELFLPLDHEQYAPPLYLILTKALAGVFGYHEYVLRLPALLGGLISVAALYAACRSLHLGVWTLLPLGLLFTNPTVLRYVTEFKPYGIDLAVAACLLAWEIRRTNGQWLAWTVAGVVLPWLSLPSVFVLAVIGLRRLRQDWRWSLIILTWLGSFGILYTLVLSPSVGSSYLNDFHAEYFMPLPHDAASFRHAFRLSYYLLRLFFGFTVVALVWGTVTALTGIFVGELRRYTWLLAPLGIVTLASSLQLYTLIDRLMLFALPGVWLFTALCAAYIFRRLSGWQRIAYVLMTVVALGGTNIYRAVIRPYRFSDSRELAAWAGRYPYVADKSAVPVLDYYLRVKPETGSEINVNRPPVGADFPTSDVSVLFDGTNNAITRTAVDNYRKRAAERRCNTDWQPLFRTGILTIRCPEPNYDR
ncbi:hypothetical protein [Lewinella sp. IMCC34191]|uniref:hypothetical protein n=1 Tax=Lewinella sp. IMCC34191 TaxID=2259172 RepID=UPI000E248E0C|nr:hypothetical protein [Lewinella sp. IMCC34191]